MSKCKNNKQCLEEQRQEKDYNAWEDIKTMLEFGVYAFIYGS